MAFNQQGLLSKLRGQNEPAKTTPSGSDDKFIYYGHYPTIKVTDAHLLGLLSSHNGVCDVGGHRYARLGNDWYRFEPVRWVVIKDDGKRLLCLSESVIDAAKMDIDGDTDYAQTSLGKAMGKEIANRLFGIAGGKSGLVMAVPGDVIKTDTLYGELDGDDVSLSAIYPPSRAEIDGYFGTNEKKKAKATPYVEAKMPVSLGHASYWLRNHDSIEFQMINAFGVPGEMSSDEAVLGVRPMIMVDKAKVVTSNPAGTIFGAVPIYDDGSYASASEGPKVPEAKGEEGPSLPGDGGKMRGKKVGDRFFFGAYPQTKLVDASIIAKLNSMTPNSSGDLTLDGRKYRKVKGNYYRYEPIAWIPLSYSGDITILMAARALELIDDAPVQDPITRVLQFLDNDFYEVAFADFDQAGLTPFMVDRTAGGANRSSDPFAKGNESHKAFLLSYKQMMDPSLFKDGTMRLCQASDYLNAKGAIKTIRRDGTAVESGVPYITCSHCQSGPNEIIYSVNPVDGSLSEMSLSILKKIGLDFVTTNVVPCIAMKKAEYPGEL